MCIGLYTINGIEYVYIVFYMHKPTKLCFVIVYRRRSIMWSLNGCV